MESGGDGIDVPVAGDEAGAACTDPQLADRIWQHALHEENVLNDRLNYFLIAEAMLLVFYAEVIGKVSTSSLVAIGVAGIVLTIMWLFVNARQFHDLNESVRRVKTQLPGTLPDFPDPKVKAVRSGGKIVIGYLIPLVVGGIWIALIVSPDPEPAPATSKAAIILQLPTAN